MEVSKQEAEVIFRKLEIKERSTDHKRGWFVHEGKKILKVYYSQGKGKMPGHIGDKFRTSFKVNIEQFVGLRDCPLDKLGYIEILKKKGLIV